MDENIKEGSVRVSDILSIIHDNDLEQFQRAKGFDWVDTAFKNAANRGNAFHSIMEKAIKGDDFSEEMEFCEWDFSKEVELTSEWFRQMKLTPIEAESRYYGRLGGLPFEVTGSPDVICKDSSGKIVVVDYKTTSKMLLKHKVQIAAYCWLVGSKDVPAYIIYAREGRIKPVVIKDLSLYTGMFINAANAYKYWVYCEA
jgi:hypothetical protein